MAFTQFPNQQYFIVLPTDATTGVGYFNLQDGTELKHIMITILQVGVISSPYNLRMKLYSSSSLATPIITSDWATISVATLVPTYTVNWLGNIYLDFQGNPLNPNLNYFMAVETSGYTLIADTYYVGINLDWYSPVNSSVDSTTAGARIRILGKR